VVCGVACPVSSSASGNVLGITFVSASTEDEQSLLSRAHPPNLFQIPFEGSGDALFSLVERCICPRNSFSTAARMKALGLS
jgi:hypothetical protein